MKKRVIYITIGFIISLLIASSLILVITSPFKEHENYSHRLIKKSVIIDASPSEVFAYLSDSSKAKDWSVFVDSIKLLNGQEKKDGSVGSLRRCYKKDGEHTKTWDEEILMVKPDSYRLLSCYNFKNFKYKAKNLRTEQVYKALDNGSTELSLTLYFNDGKANPIDAFEMYFFAGKISSIFKRNLRQIKDEVEH